jgi:hypothetical protein
MWNRKVSAAATRAAASCTIRTLADAAADADADTVGTLDGLGLAGVGEVVGRLEAIGYIESAGDGWGCSDSDTCGPDLEQLATAARVIIIATAKVLARTELQLRWLGTLA